MTNNNYIEWLTETKADETKAVKKVAEMAKHLKICYQLETAVLNPDHKKMPLNQQYIEVVNQNADQLDCLCCELGQVIEDIKKMMELVEELSGIRHDLETYTEEDFED